MIRKIKEKLESNCPDLGKLLLRFSSGTIFLFAGLMKLMSIEGTIGFFTGIFGAGMAPFLAWLVALTEFGGGLALLLGIFPRISGLLLSFIMLVAVATVQFPAMLGLMADGQMFIQAFSKVRLDFLLLFVNLAIALLGPGKYSLEEYLKLKWKY